MEVTLADLTALDGVGVTKAQRLIAVAPTVEDLASYDKDTLSQVAGKGVTAEVAETVINWARVSLEAPREVRELPPSNRETLLAVNSLISPAAIVNGSVESDETVVTVEISVDANNTKRVALPLHEANALVQEHRLRTTSKVRIIQEN